MQVSITKAAAHLHISQQTVRRRLANGLLSGEKRETPQGYKWLVEVPDQDQEQRQPTNDNNALVAALEARIAAQEHELGARRQEVDQLHRLLAAKALEGPENRPWWQFWG